MRIGCIYTVERGASRDKPLFGLMDIPFGLATIATLLESSGYNTDVLVFAETSRFEARLHQYMESCRPRLLCFTSVSTQFHFVQEIAQFAKEIDPSVFIVLGGHHASLAPEESIAVPSFDAICIGEGDSAAVELARGLEREEPITGVSNLWIKQTDGSVVRNPTLPFTQDLDSLPYVNRRMWEPWIQNPAMFPSILLGRGCPFRCSYCSNHAMKKLSRGRYTRFRSPQNIVREIAEICSSYPDVDSIYLEVETIAHQRVAYPLLGELERFNANRASKIAFGLNFTVTSVFMGKDERSREFVSLLRQAGVTYLNIGLESGSERLRSEVLKRPKYTNSEFIRFADLAREYNIELNLYVLMGVPGETHDEYKETVLLVRQVQPNNVFLSIFYPYQGTSLWSTALDEGLISEGALDIHAERTRPVLNSSCFSRTRLRFEYLLFWFRVFRGHWPAARILVQTLKSVVAGSPRLWALYNGVKEHSRVFSYLRDLYHDRMKAHEDKSSSCHDRLEGSGSFDQLPTKNERSTR
jgi:radical SAM superfamily enzyme YgiQ (UPF0313 family)